MNIPFYRPSIDEGEIQEVADVLRSGWLTTGPKAKLFEDDFGSYMKQKHSVAVNSCTAALHLALEAVGVGPGDSVLVPTLTFAATAEAVHYLGARPILVDCRESDFNMDMEDAERQFEAAERNAERVKAIIPVHYGGQIGDLDGLASCARRHQLKIVTDAAHCCPAYYRTEGDRNWKPVGSEADVSCFSFYANKPITTGEGGMACTADPQLADRMRIMSLHGISRDAWKRFMPGGTWYYEITDVGYKYNMTDIAAAIGLRQLAKAERMHKRREKLANLYMDLLSDVPEIKLPSVQSDRIHSWHLFVIRLDLGELSCGRDSVITQLKEMGVGTSVHYLPLHMHPYYRNKYNYHSFELPVAAKCYSEMITLPLYPDMSDEQVEYVCECLKTIIQTDHEAAVRHNHNSQTVLAAL